MATRISGAVLRTVRLLDALSTMNGASTRGLAALVGESHATVHRTLLALQATGMVEHHPETGYRLSAHALTLGLRVPLHRRLQERAQGPMRGLSEAVRLPVVLSLRDRHRVLYVLGVDAPGRRLRSPSRPGDLRAMYCTASGKVLLTHGDPAVVDAVVSEGLAGRTSRTITTSADLSDELDGVRASGYAIDVGEHTDGWVAVAAPVYGPHGGVEAALAVCGPAGDAALTARARSALLRGADTMTRLVGHDPAA